MCVKEGLGGSNLVETLRLELEGNAEHGLAHGNDQATVNDELGELRAALVAVPAVPHEQLCQVVELLDGEIGCETGLATFLADDADADVGSLNHRDIVAAVTNAAHALLGVLLDKLGDLGFLRGRAPARDHGREEDGDGDELGPVMRQVHAEALAVNQ